jgi:hypothetical protein
MARFRSRPLERREQSFAFLSGFLFLWLLVNGFVGGLIFPHLPADASIQGASAAFAPSERLYRLGLLSQLIETLSGVVLAFALYELLKAPAKSLGLLAMIFMLLDTFLAAVVRAAGFLRLDLYAASTSDSSAEAMARLMQMLAEIAENIGGICYGLGLLLFFLLFLRSRYLPTLVSALGVLASTIWIVCYVAILVFPEMRSSVRFIAFVPMAIVDAATGICLVLFAITRERGRAAAPPPI